MTARANADGILRPHWALVCASSAPLAFGELGELDFARLVNVPSGNKLGASQVTAVVRQLDEVPASKSGALYPVVLRVALAAPYLLRLHDPVPA